MAHLLRKYTSNRGSALFMVISTMTALIISCMAMYFSMVSSRSAQYAVFNKMQANQTATSISKIVVSALSDKNHDMYKRAQELGKGESITTSANGFKSLDPSKATGEDESQLGAYSVTITCTDVAADGTRTIDVMVVSSVGGNRDAVHMALTTGTVSVDDTTGTGDGSGGDAELFAATGYVPNDAYINGGYYLTDVFYDTQYTYMNTFGGSGENRIGQNLYTGGDLMLGTDAMSVVHSASSGIAAADVNKIGPVTWAIRGNFYPSLNSDMGLRGGSQILVGGNFEHKGNGNNLFYIKNDGYADAASLPDHICIYVNGDFNYDNQDIKSNTWVFVNGNVTGGGGNGQGNVRIFVTGTPEERAAKTSSFRTSLPIEEWPKSGTFAAGLTYNEAMKLLGEKTQTIAYYKWDISKNTQSADTQHIDIRLNASNQSWTDDKGTTYEPYESTYVIAYDNNADSAKYIKGHGGNENGVIGKSFVIDSVWTHGDNNNGQTIIIDTGDDPNNIMTIKLSDVTGNGEFSWFMEREEKWISYWPPEVEYGDGKTPTGMINNNVRLVLLKGRGTVLIDVPKGLTYQDSGYQLTGHVGWYLIEGGKIETKNLNGKDHITFSGIDPQGKYSEKIVPYIHKTCEDGDGCTFSTSDSTTKCSVCSGTLTKVKCAIHGDVNSYCHTCHPENAARTDWCKNHVDNLKFKSLYNSLSGENKAAVTDKSGDIIYPTTNFMYVSCDESAEMYFSQTTDGRDITNNTLFGFIYAPYMSYLASSTTQAGGLCKLCGGLTVGDYDIRAIYSFIGCYPDKMPNELAGMAGGGSIAGGKLAGTTKTWKVVIGGYS